jgi:cation:H+ antiporter
VSQQLVRLDVPIMIGLSGSCCCRRSTARLGRLDGALLVAGAAAYT